MSRYLKKRKKGFYFVMDIPARHRPHFGGKKRFEQTLGTRDEALAQAKADRLAGEYKLQFLALDGNGAAERALARLEYARAQAEVQQLPADQAEVLVDVEIDKVELEVVKTARPIAPDDEGPELPEAAEARIAGLVDGLALLKGDKLRHRRKFEPPFKELADRWLEGWKARPDRRASNTGVQYAAAIRLFHEYWGNRPLRDVQQPDAAEFVELLKKLPAGHGRGKLAGMTLKEAVEAHGGNGPGLSTPSIKRHLGVLKQIWAWAKPLGYCAGEDPFQVRLEKHRKRPSLGWEPKDLRRLFAQPPLRRDIYEAFYVAMFTGLRVHEIADLTWGQIREEQGVPYIMVEDAKTEAGIRKVPLHSKLGWLLEKPRGADDAPVFPTFTPEGPRKSRGGDASKLFGQWKKKLGVAPRRYVFHSARKNVTGIMEEHAIPANVWARIIGHEPGFTYGTYNPTGLTLRRAKETIELIDYPEVNMPIPAEVYGNAAKLPPEKRRQRETEALRLAA